MKIKRENTIKMLPIVLLIVVPIIVMWRYLTGEMIFVFEDIASDSVAQIYPSYLNYARTIEQGNIAALYNFTIGLGTPQGAMIPNFSNWVCFFGEENVAYLMGVSYLIKLILSGLFFYGFLREKKTESWFATILALGYAFCGHMTIRGSWEAYPNEVFLIAGWLWAFERWFQKKDYRWLPLATVLFFLTRGSTYNIVVYTAIFIGYVFFRYKTERSVRNRHILIVLCIAIIGITVGLFITNFSIVYSIKDALSSQRAATIMAQTDWSVKAFLPDWSILPVILARTIGTTMLNMSYGYAGQLNFLEDPTFYCGLTVLLVIPMAYMQMDRKRKVWYGFAYLLAAVYCLCKPLRIALNGFANETFKLSSFWITLLLLLTVSNVNWKINDKKQKCKNAILVLFAELGLQLSLFSIAREIDGVIYTWKDSCILLMVEGIVLIWIIWEPEQRLINRALCIIVVTVEAVWLTYPIYSMRGNAAKDTYMDETKEMVNYIATFDDNFYRIDKQCDGKSDNDSVAYGYNSTQAYIGGTGVDANVLRLYTDLGIHDGINVRTIISPSAYNEVNTLLGVKYILSQNDGVSNYGYEQIDRIGEIRLFRNEYAAPMGFVYSHVISRSQFEQLNYKERQWALMDACLVDEDTNIPELTDEEIQLIRKQSDLFDIYEIPFEYSTETYRFEFEPSTEDEVILVKIHFESDAGEFAKLKFADTDGKEYEVKVSALYSAGGQIFEMIQGNVNALWIDSKASYDSIRIAKVPKTIYYQGIETAIAQQQESKVILQKTEDNYMEGSFFSGTDGILYLPVVNNGWRILIDGEEQDIITVNDAFIGVPVTEGLHELQMICSLGTWWNGYKKVAMKLVICLCIIALGSYFTKRKGSREKDERNISRSSSI